MSRLSYGAFLTINKISANGSILWLWALSLKSNNVPAVVNLLIQDNVLKIKGNGSKKRIYPTTRGQKLIRELIDTDEAQEYQHLVQLRRDAILACLIVIGIDFICIAFNRWYLLRTFPVMIAIAFGVIAISVMPVTYLDDEMGKEEMSIMHKNKNSRILQLWKEYNFKWNHNLQKYLIKKPNPWV